MFEKTADTDQKRDGGADNEKNSENNRDTQKQPAFYRSQQEVDEAFKKRFKALKEKWESEQKENQKTESDEQRVLNLIEKIDNQSDTFNKRYPDVDLYAVVQENPLFGYLVMSGKDVVDTYEFLYTDSLKQRIKDVLEQEIISNMKARKLRPRVMNASNSGGSSKDIARLSDAEILRIDKRIKDGERVTL